MQVRKPPAAPNVRREIESDGKTLGAGSRLPMGHIEDALDASRVLTIEEISALAHNGGKPAETLMNVCALIARRRARVRTRSTSASRARSPRLSAWATRPAKIESAARSSAGGWSEQWSWRMPNGSCRSGRRRRSPNRPVQDRRAPVPTTRRTGEQASARTRAGPVTSRRGGRPARSGRRPDARSRRLAPRSRPGRPARPAERPARARHRRQAADRPARAR